MKLFGTDGIRDKALEGRLAPDRVRAVGRALADRGDRWVCARDPRASGPRIRNLLAEGLASEGGTLVDAGMLPTPALAILAAELPMAGGIMISASHNPPAYNGIKIFDHDGMKLTLADQDLLESAILTDEGEASPPDEAPELETLSDGLERYTAHLTEEFSDLDLSETEIVLDMARGATAGVAEHVFEAFGARIVPIHGTPDPDRINVACGSLDPTICRGLVRERGAAAGFAFDGDGDRVIFCDDRGQIQDGDTILAICALDMVDRDCLGDRTVVGTVMTNVGLELLFRERGIDLHRTPVGDRHVLAAMLENDWNLGGETSGHIIFGDKFPTGDGIRTALALLEVHLRTGQPLSELASVYEPAPQILINVPVSTRPPLDDLDAVVEARTEAEKALQGRGRIVLRYSGTEPLCRVMVESPDERETRSWAERIAEAVEASIGEEAS